MQGAKDATTGIQVLKYDAIEIYPNPFTTTLHLKIDNPDDIVRIAVFDMMGRQVEVIEHSSVNSSLTLGSSLQPNMYIVQITGRDGEKTVKVIKK